MRTGRRGRMATLVFGQLAVVVVAAVVVAQREQPVATVRAVAASAIDAGEITPLTFARVVPRRTPGAAATAPADARVATLPRTDAPTWVQIPRFGVRASVLPMGVAPDGAMDTPPDPAVVGWYVGGAKPGDVRGSTVLDGHVDSAATGPGAFYDLVRLAPGDTVVVGGPAGTVRYAVTKVTERRKSLEPAPDVFDMSVPARLVLITCGGAFNTAVGHYVDNIVVFARPVSATRG
jgi:hypothetical protein